jgi:hypothetical protein
MTLGDGIFWSTVLLLLAATFYLATVRKKWKTVGKVAGVLVLTITAIAGSVWGWSRYQNRPYTVETFAGVRLGMRPLEVKLTKGAPTDEGTLEKDDDGKFRMEWVFGDSTNEQLAVLFYGSDEADLKVSVVCESGGYDTLLGIGRFHKEEDVRQKLGAPTSESIAADGLAKLMSFKKWKVAFEVSKGSVADRCITESGGVSYIDEYQAERKERKPNP